MAKNVKLWHGPERGRLEVMLGQKAGSFRETESDQGMGKADRDGNVIGFSTLRVSTHRDRPLEWAVV